MGNAAWWVYGWSCQYRWSLKIHCDAIWARRSGRVAAWVADSSELSMHSCCQGTVGAQRGRAYFCSTAHSCTSLIHFWGSQLSMVIGSWISSTSLDPCHKNPPVFSIDSQCSPRPAIIRHRLGDDHLKSKRLQIYGKRENLNKSTTQIHSPINFNRLSSIKILADDKKTTEWIFCLAAWLWNLFLLPPVLELPTVRKKEPARQSQHVGGIWPEIARPTLKRSL